MAIGTGTVLLSDIKNEFGGTFPQNNLRSYLKCNTVITTSGPFDTPGSSSVTSPAGANTVIIEMWGGGGGGGRGRWINEEAFGGGGGGGGAYTKKIVALPAQYTFNYTVGAAGTAGTSLAAPGNGGDTIVSWLTNTLTSGGGLGGQNAATTNDGLGGPGGVADSAGDVFLNGENGVDGGGNGGYSPLGGLGGAGRVGSLAGIAGSAPGGGGGGNYGNDGLQANGGAGAAGRIKFTWLTGGSTVAEHENNTGIPTSGTIKIGDFRSTSTYKVDKDFESDTYTGLTAITNVTIPFNGYEGKSGLFTSAASNSLGLTISQLSGGSIGIIDGIGKNIGSTGQTCILNSIFDYASVSVNPVPLYAALFLNGDQRITTWASPWSKVAITINNITNELLRYNAVNYDGTYNATYNVTYWIWNQIFGFPNSGSSSFNFTTRIVIT